MAINKITNEQRELMRQKSAQSLPDVPSSKGWTPKNFKDAMTKPLFDNENSFFAFYNALVEQIENIKFDKEDYDFKNLGQFASEKEFASACESDYYNSQRENKNFAYKGYITSNGNQSTALCLVGYTSGSGMNFDSMVISHKGITCYKQGNEVATQMPKVEVSDLKVNVSTSVPYPSSNESATNKYYVDSNHYKKSDVDSKITDTKNYAYNLTGEAINVASSTAKHYYDESVAHTDAKFNELKSVLDTILKDAPTAYDTLKEIANYIASDKTGASEMMAKINTNTSNIASLNANKLGKNDKVPYENVINAPETLDIILRSEVSPDTTDEVKEIEINGMKFKLTGASGSGEAVNGTPISSDNLPLHTLSFNTSMSNEEVEKLLQLIYDSSTFKQDNMAPIFIGSNEVMLLVYSENNPESPEWAGCALCLRHGMSWRYIYQSIDYAGDGYVGWHPVLKDKNYITMSELSVMIGNSDISDIVEFQFVDTSLTDMLTPLVSMNDVFENGGTSGSGGGTSNRILTLSDVLYEFEDEDGIFNLYILNKLENQNLLIDFDKEFPDYQYKELTNFEIYIKDSVNSQVLVKFSENYLLNLSSVVEESSLSINYEYRLTSLDSNKTFGKVSSISTYEESSYIVYELAMTDGTNVVKVNFDAFGNGTSYISYNMEV